MRVSAAGNMPLQGLVKPPAKPVVMIYSYVTHAGGMYSPDCDRVVKSIASKGGTPLVVAKNHKILGVIYLKDIIKQGVKEKFSDLREMGIKTIS